MLDPSPFPQLTAPRLAKTLRRLETAIWSVDDEPLTVAASTPTVEPVDVLKAISLDYRPIRKTRHVWGRMFDQRWWKLRVPRQSDDTQRYLYWTDQAEATLYHKGIPIFGIDPAHVYAPLPNTAGELLIESTCCRSGVWMPIEVTRMSPDGSVFRGAFLATRDDDAWHAWHDLKMLIDTLLLVPRPDAVPGNAPTSPYGYRPPFEQAPPIFRAVMRQLQDAIDLYERQGTDALRKALRDVYRGLEIPRRSHTAVLTGHAHLDLVWLWPRRVGRFKAVHSFANALSVMDRYPEFHFGYSQTASYRDVAAESPETLDRVKLRIHSGQWEANGALEVESDTQLPCGEALLRSFTLGLEGFETLNGKKRGPGKTVWLPDTFGYSGCIPQIMAGLGLPYFFTTKIHWGSATKFPYTSFRWVGPDGSEVITHLIRDHYNLRADPGELRKITLEHQQSDVHPEILVPTGFGDGGGGPNDDMAERAKRMSRLGLLGEAAGVPDVKWGRIDDFFDRLAQHRERLPAWRGEMYLQYHRGVQTTHGDLKAAYRAAERALQTWEAVRCATGGGPLDHEHWQRLVFTQFHDCLPGSSIWEVCRDTVADMEQLASAARRSALDELTVADGEASVFNPLAMPNYHATDRSVWRVPPLTGAPRASLEKVDAGSPKASVKKLENQRVCARFDRFGQVRALLIDGQDLQLRQAGAQLWTFPDTPAAYDAWDIDRAALSNGQPVTGVAEAWIEKPDTLQAAACFKRAVGENSRVTVRYRLDPVRPALLIDLDIDWQEPQMLLKLLFPTRYHGREARFGAPFGSTLRPQTAGPIERDAMFEVPASRWAAVSDDGERDGLAVVTEAKYGFGCREGLLHVSLLRSAKITEPVQGAPQRTNKNPRTGTPMYSDLGRHRIRLAIGRHHADAPLEEQAAAWADTLFTPPLPYRGRPVSAGLDGLDAPNGTVPAWAKPLARNRWALRLHEVLGRRGTCHIQADSNRTLARLDLHDRITHEIEKSTVNNEPYALTSVEIKGR